MDPTRAEEYLRELEPAVGGMDNTRPPLETIAARARTRRRRARALTATAVGVTAVLLVTIGIFAIGRPTRDETAIDTDRSTTSAATTTVPAVATGHLVFAEPPVGYSVLRDGEDATGVRDRTGELASLHVTRLTQDAGRTSIEISIYRNTGRSNRLPIPIGPTTSVTARRAPAEIATSGAIRALAFADETGDFVLIIGRDSTSDLLITIADSLQVAP